MANGLPQLIIENHPSDYTGFPFITLIQYRKELLLVVIDNSTNSTIQGYVLDLCTPEGVDEGVILPIIEYWYENNRHNYPLSIQFSKMGLTHDSSKIYKTLNIEFITRFIGPLYHFPMNNIKSLKKRKKKPISNSIEIINHSIIA